MASVDVAHGIPEATRRICVRILGMGLSPDQEPVYWMPGSDLRDGWFPTLTIREAQTPCGDMSPSQLVAILQRFAVPFAYSKSEHESTLTDNKSTPVPSSTIDHDWTRTLSWLTHFISSNLSFGAAYAWAMSILHHPQVAKNQRTSDKWWTPYLQVTAYNPLLMDEAFEDESSLVGLTPEGLHIIRNVNVYSCPSPRRVWDVASNRVVPFRWIPPSHGQSFETSTGLFLTGISHSWTDDMELTWSDANSYQWPIPLPRSITLEGVRQALLVKGHRYCWLDALCLRQAQCENAGYPERVYEPEASQKVAETKNRSTALEEVRYQEWKVDVPLIGKVYRKAAHVIYYLNGLGRPFDRKLIAIEDREPVEVPYGYYTYQVLTNFGISSPSDRHWLNRAWVLQEMIRPDEMSLGSPVNPEDQEFFITQVKPKLRALFNSSYVERSSNVRRPPQRNTMVKIIAAMAPRSASHPLDKLVGIMFLQYNFYSDGLPIYDRSQDIESIWAHNIQRTMNSSGYVSPFATEMLYEFPHPSASHWFPSWRQAMAYPDLSATEAQSSDKDVIDAGRPVLREESSNGILAWLDCRLTRESLALLEGPDTSMGGPNDTTCYKLYIPVKEREQIVEYPWVAKVPESEFPNGIPEEKYLVMSSCARIDAINLRVVLCRVISVKDGVAKTEIYGRKVAAVELVRNGEKDRLLLDGAKRRQGISNCTICLY